MEVTSIEKSKLGKSNLFVPAMGMGTIAQTPKILSILALVAFIFTGCEIQEKVEEIVIPTSFYTNNSSGHQTGVVSGENIVVSIRGSGGITLSGTCNFAEITVSSSGVFSGSNLETREAEVNIRGAGSIYVWVTDRLYVNIQGSGNVYYKGNPLISSNIGGSGKLIKL